MSKPSEQRETDGGSGALGDFLEIAEVIIVALDTRGAVIHLNRKARDVLGCPEGDLAGADWFDTFIPERLRAEMRAVHGEVVGGRHAETVEHYENPVLTRSGEERIIAWHNTLLKERGRVVGTLSSGEDVTERRRIEDELRRSHKALEDMHYALDQAAIVAITDQRGAITYVNDTFCAISKYPREELLGKNHRIINSGHHPREFFQNMWRTIAAGRSWRGEVCNRAKDGSLYWVDTTIVPFLDERGRPYQYLAIRSDITARKHAEEELRRREALHQIGQMAAIVAHEVKNPLAGIAGAVQIVGDRLPGDSADRPVIASVLQRIDALNERLKDLLLYARPRAPRLGPLRLGRLVRDTADLLAKDAALTGVRVDIGGEDPALSGDADLLRDMFLNLLLNAAQATGGEGLVTVGVEGDDGRCTVTIADDGPGIPNEVRERLFEPFVTTKSRGTGLGLAIVRNIVEAHGGDIEIVSGDGGTTVIVRLPRRPVPEPDDPGPD